MKIVSAEVKLTENIGEFRDKLMLSVKLIGENGRILSIKKLDKKEPKLLALFRAVKTLGDNTTEKEYLISLQQLLMEIAIQFKLFIKFEQYKKLRINVKPKSTNKNQV